MFSSSLSKVLGLSTHAVLCVGVSGACLVAWLMASRTNACTQKAQALTLFLKKAVHVLK